LAVKDVRAATRALAWAGKGWLRLPRRLAHRFGIRRRGGSLRRPLSRRNLDGCLLGAGRRSPRVGGGQGGQRKTDDEGDAKIAPLEVVSCGGLPRFVHLHVALYGRCFDDVTAGLSGQTGIEHADDADEKNETEN
jgi:hypothetical protein